MFTAMACLCVLLSGPSYAAGAESLIIAGATYCEPGVSGPGWAWTDADHLELNGYAGEAIGADGDLVLTLAGQNSVTESQAPDADITLCGMEVWGNLTLRGTGTLTATGSQCGIHVSQALVVDGCTVDARADGADISEETVAGVIAGDMAVRGGGRVVAAGAGSGAGVRAYGVYLQDTGLGAVALLAVPGLPLLHDRCGPATRAAFDLVGGAGGVIERRRADHVPDGLDREAALGPAQLRHIPFEVDHQVLGVHVAPIHRGLRG